MKFFNEKYLDNWERSSFSGRSPFSLRDSVDSLESLKSIYESFSRKPDGQKKYDIFLSHRYSDRENVARLANLLKKKFNNWKS